MMQQITQKQRSGYPALVHVDDFNDDACKIVARGRLVGPFKDPDPLKVLLRLKL